MKTFKSGKYINQGTYKSFQPETINRPWYIDNMELFCLLTSADRALGKLDMFSEYVPNIDLSIFMCIANEANKSSQIEGTKTNIKDVLLDKEDVSEEKRDDWEEVQNYISALNLAINKLGLPFSSRLIKEIHKELLTGVRGKHKLPGEYRNSQNWIGGKTIKDAVFIPPTFHIIEGYMNDLEKFVHNNKYPIPDLLKIAIVHYQFETIHPFLDGNGRVGRLLITFYMIERGLLKRPVLYLSDFFERNRVSYYDSLTKVRERNDINQWVKFFLIGVIETAKKSISTFDGILKLQKEMEDKLRIRLGSRYKNAKLIIDSLFQKPIINAKMAQKITKLSLPSVYQLLYTLKDLKVIDELTEKKRERIFIFNDYINLF